MYGFAILDLAVEDNVENKEAVIWPCVFWSDTRIIPKRHRFHIVPREGTRDKRLVGLGILYCSHTSFTTTTFLVILPLCLAQASSQACVCLSVSLKISQEST